MLDARAPGAPAPARKAPTDDPADTALRRAVVPARGEDVSGVVTDVLAGLDPVAAVRASLLARLPALDGLLPADSVPTTLALAPSFSDGLADDLIRLGPEFLLPGAGELGNNRVRMVESDATFAAVFLIAANHELARELLWRGYPVDLRATFFQRFWRYVEPGDRPTSTRSPAGRARTRSPRSMPAGDARR